MVSVAELSTSDSSASGLGARARRVLGRNRIFAAVFAVGAVLRAVTMLGYGPAMWFNDTYQYVSVAMHPRPDVIRPSMYGLWLALLKPFSSFTLVVFLQHLMGLATAVIVYALLKRRFGVPGWAATLAAAPVLLDAYQIQMEQLVMSDSMFTLVVTGVVALVLWKRELTWRVGAVVGALLALAALTRSIGLAVLGLVVVYMLIKRVGWKPIVAMVIACALPVGGYMSWFAAANGTFAMTYSDGLILYMRTASFADCRQMDLKIPQELDMALLCLDAPGRKGHAQWYLWGMGRGENKVGVSGEVLHRQGSKKFDRERNDAAGRFAKRAILAQPGDYLSVVFTDFMRSFAWQRTEFPEPKTYSQYEFRPDGYERLPTWSTYGGGNAGADAFRYEQGPPETNVRQPWANIMAGYQDVFYLRGTLLGAILLVGLYGLVARWRRLGGPVLLPWLGAVGLLLAPAATAEFDYRYVLPAVPLACIAAAITLRPRSAAASAPTSPNAAPSGR
ncbi:hypothetical protein [Nonomuraea sp. NPDC050310]|uniref:hypothetical protein n=1 Tax=Nonomuraea sp. NPDC050310 TaxID=3154935 RepID=UPI0033C16D61